MMKTVASKQSAYLSKEQFYKACHISKATALRLIKSGLIPVIDTHKQTKRYLIAREDVVTFMREREKNPEKYKLNSVQTYGGFRAYKPSVGTRMRRLAQADWINFPDVLSVQDVVELLGYQKKTVYRWRKEYGLKGIQISGIHYIPKSSLLDFIASPDFHRIQRKSEKHIDLLRRASYERK